MKSDEWIDARIRRPHLVQKDHNRQCSDWVLGLERQDRESPNSHTRRCIIVRLECEAFAASGSEEACWKDPGEEWFYDITHWQPLPGPPVE